MHVRGKRTLRSSSPSSQKIIRPPSCWFSVPDTCLQIRAPMIQKFIMSAESTFLLTASGTDFRDKEVPICRCFLGVDALAYGDLGFHLIYII